MDARVGNRLAAKQRSHQDGRQQCDEEQAASGQRLAQRDPSRHQDLELSVRALQSCFGIRRHLLNASG